MVAGLDARFGWTSTLGVIWYAAGIAVLILESEDVIAETMLIAK